jgi:hypothetical protein
MDQSEAASTNIKKIINDISKNLQAKIESVKKDALELKRKQQEQSRDFSIQISTLIMSTFEDSNREVSTLSNRKAMLRKSLDKEEADILKLEKENQDFQKQVEELESLNRGIKDRKQDAEDKYKLLMYKVQQLKGKVESKENEHKNVNEIYKKYLGLNIVKIKDNVVKILYNNLGNECYIILDFTSTDCVTESFPEINLEKLNYLFKEKKNFYEFIKCVRELLKQKL